MGNLVAFACFLVYLSLVIFLIYIFAFFGWNLRILQVWWKWRWQWSSQNDRVLVNWSGYPSLSSTTILLKSHCFTRKAFRFEIEYVNICLTKVSYAQHGLIFLTRSISLYLFKKRFELETIRKFDRCLVLTSLFSLALRTESPEEFISRYKIDLRKDGRKALPEVVNKVNLH